MAVLVRSRWMRHGEMRLVLAVKVGMVSDRWGVGAFRYVGDRQ